MPLPFSCGAGEHREQQHKCRSLPAPHPARPRRAACNSRGGSPVVFHALASHHHAGRSSDYPDHTCLRRRRQDTDKRRAARRAQSRYNAAAMATQHNEQTNIPVRTGSVAAAGLRHAGIFALFLALASWWTRPLIAHLADSATGSGDPLITAWRLIWPAQWWLRDRPAPFWDTNVLYPATSVFARDELTLGGSLIAGPLYVLTGSTLVAYNLTVLLTLTLSGFTMYVLVWFLWHNRVAGVIAGSIIAFAPWHIAQLDHAGLLAVQYFPLMLLFLYRTLRLAHTRDAALFALCAALQAMSAGYYAYWAALLVLLFAGYVIATQWGRMPLPLRAAGIGKAAGSLLIAAVCLLPVALPFWRVAAQESFARTTREVEYWSARPVTWLTATPSNLLYGPLVRAHAWTWSTEMYLFPGGIALALAGIAIVRSRRGWRGFAVAVAVAGFTLSFGPTLHLTRHDPGLIPLPFALLVRVVPGANALRAPLRAAPLAMIGIALLAAGGWTRLSAAMRGGGRGAGTIRRAVALLVIAALLAEYATAPVAVTTVPQLSGAQQAFREWLAAQPTGIVAVLPDLRAPVIMALATTNHHRFLNGDAEILPPGTQALFDRLGSFPDERSIAALEALGVNYVVLTDTGPLRGQWQTLPATLSAYTDDLTPLGEWPGIRVYRLAPPSHRFAALLEGVPVGSQVQIMDDLARSDTLLDAALVAHLLRDREVRGVLYAGWISDPRANRPENMPDFLLVRRDTVSTRTAGSFVWANDAVAVYRLR